MIPGADSVEKIPSLAYSLVSMWKCREQEGGSQFTWLPYTSTSGGWICRTRTLVLQLSIYNYIYDTVFS